MTENNHFSQLFQNFLVLKKLPKFVCCCTCVHWHDRKHAATVADTNEFAPHDLLSTEVLSNCLLNMIKQDKPLEANIPLRTALEKYVLDTTGEKIRKFPKFCKPKYFANVSSSSCL